MQQNLLVDFCSFAVSIKQLCDRCGEGDAKFGLVLRHGSDDADAVLNFQETNPFRELCHLSLKMCRGTDKQVKEYLVECIKHLQGRGQREETRARNLDGELEAARSRLLEREEEVARLKTHTSEQSSGFGARLAEEVAREKERAVKAAEETQQRHDTERKGLAEKHAEQVKEISVKSHQSENFLQYCMFHNFKWLA